MISKCSTRPIIGSIVSALPELSPSLKETRGRLSVDTMLGGWPVTGSVNNCMRIGAQLGLANLSISIIPFVRFLSAYLNHNKAIEDAIPIKKHMEISDETVAGLRTALKTVCKYLVPDGIHLDLCVKFKMEVLHYYVHDARSDNTEINEPRHITDMVFNVNTPFDASDMDTPGAKKHIGNQQKKFVLNFRIELFLLDLLEDFFSLVNLVNAVPVTKDARGSSSKGAAASQPQRKDAGGGGETAPKEQGSRTQSPNRPDKSKKNGDYR